MTAGPAFTDVPGEGWWIDGVYLADIGTFMGKEGWDDTAAARGENQELLGIEGVAWREKLLGAGQIPITLGIHGARWDGFQWLVPDRASAERALYEANLDRLLRLIGRRNREIVAMRVYPDGSRRQCRAEVTPSITPQMTGDAFGQVQFVLTVLGGVMEDVDQITSRLAYRVTGPDTQTLEVFSLEGQTASCADAEVTVYGPCTSVSIVDAETGRGVSYPAALSSSDVLVIQPDGRFAATKNGTSVITSVQFSGSRLLRLSPAPDRSTGPSVIVNAPGKSAGFQVTVRSRSKWLR